MANPSKPASKRSPNRAANNFDRLFGTAQGSRQSSGLLLIDRERIETGPQPRQDFAPDELDSLAASIRDLRAKSEGVEGTGILQPLLVCALPGQKFRLIAGERRLRASALAGLTALPAVVVPLRADGLLVTQLVENLQRADLSPLEEADAVAQLAQDQEMSVRGIAASLGKDRGWVQNRLRLRKVGPDVREMLSRRRDSIPHAFEIEAVSHPELRATLIELAAAGASIAEIRRRIQSASLSAPAEVLSRDAEAKVSFQNDTSNENERASNEKGLSDSASKSGNQRRNQKGLVPHDLVADALQPATALLAEAGRVLQNARLSPDDRLRVVGHLDALEKHLCGLREAVENHKNEEEVSIRAVILE